MDVSAGGHPADRIEGAAPAIEALRAQIRRLAAFDAVGGPMVPTLLLTGATGTGKGLIARVVHDSGPRARGPFLPVNCAAIPETMLEAELFGYEAGAFTDAKRPKPGLFEAAAHGTLFLDEVDSLSLGLQSKLLTAIESKRVRRLGAVAEHAVDVKLVAATQEDLGRLAAEGRFRPDLYHRLAVVVLYLPPLRERGDDVVHLARGLLQRFAAGYGVAAKQLTADAEAWLRGYPWPGNVRELGHLMERVTLLHREGRVDATTLARLVSPVSSPASPPVSSPISSPGDEAGPDDEPDEARTLRDVLARTGGNVLRAARLLGVTRDAVRYRMRRYGIERPADEVPKPRRPGRRTPPRAAVPAQPAAPPAAAASSASRPPEPATATEAPVWEHKPVAVVAIELTWPAPRGDDIPSHEPWTETTRWTRTIREKLEGLGGVLLQRNPSLELWAFGVPQTLDQLPQRAVHAALAVRNLVAGLTERDRAPALRLAVHLGAMLIESRARDAATNALPVGETLALPLRLLAHAEPGEIIVSADIEPRVAAWLDLDAFEIGGGAQRVPSMRVFRVIGIAPPRLRAGRPRRSLSPFVGRDRELETLRDLAARATAGSGLIVGIVGEPGAGKSRLLYELGQRLRDDGIRFGEAHCHVAGGVTPYLTLRDIVAIQLGLAEGEPAAAMQRVVEERLEGLGLDRERHAPYLAALLNASPPGGGDKDQIKVRTFEAARELLLADARHGPGVMAIENLHWIDPTSEEWLAALARRLTGAPLLLVTTYRPGYRPPWLDRADASQIALRPLDTDACRRLVRAAAGTTVLSATVENEILARGEGNPLFLEELTRGVGETGGARPSIPQTVHAVLAARIDRLAVDDKRVLQAASVIGRIVPLDVLTQVLSDDGPSVEERLGHLVAAELLFESSAATQERSHTFEHVLIQAAAYQTLPPFSRRALHVKVMEALESLADRGRPAALETLAHHAVEGAAWDKAVRYYAEAGRQAAAHSAAREAAACFEKALTALPHLPDNDATLAQTVRLRNAYAEALYSTRELPRALGELRAAYAVAERRGDATAQAELLIGLLHVHTAEGPLTEAAHAGERAVQMAASLGNGTLRVWASLGLCRVSFVSGNYRRGIECAREAIDGLAGEPDARAASHWVLQPAPAVRGYLALCLARTGDFAEGLARGQEAVRMAEAAGRLLDRAWAEYCLARVHHARTDFALAITRLEHALSLLEEDTFPTFVAPILAGLGSTLTQSGRAAEALPLLERALHVSRSAHLGPGESLIHVQLAEASLAAGARDDAARHGAQALEMARARGERGNEAWALHACGEAAADADHATEHVLGSLRLAEALGMRPLAARCRLSLGALHATAGRREEARKHVEAAIGELRVLGIGGWVLRAETLYATFP